MYRQVLGLPWYKGRSYDNLSSLSSWHRLVMKENCCYETTIIKLWATLKSLYATLHSTQLYFTALNCLKLCYTKLRKLKLTILSYLKYILLRLIKQYWATLNYTVLIFLKLCYIKLHETLLHPTTHSLATLNNTTQHYTSFLCSFSGNYYYCYLHNWKSSILENITRIKRCKDSTQ